MTDHASQASQVWAGFEGDGCQMAIRIWYMASGYHTSRLVAPPCTVVNSARSRMSVRIALCVHKRAKRPKMHPGSDQSDIGVAFNQYGGLAVPFGLHANSFANWSLQSMNHQQKGCGEIKKRGANWTTSYQRCKKYKIILGPRVNVKV